MLLFSSLATARWCIAPPDQNITEARRLFKINCVVSWNDQKHVCDYKPDGFHCQGEVPGDGSSFTFSGDVPPAPENLFAKSENNGDLWLSWSNPFKIGIAGYNVYRNGKYLDTVPSNFAYKVIRYQDTSAPRGSSIEYYVIAFDVTKQHFSPKSNTVTFVTAPSSKQSLSATSRNNMNGVPNHKNGSISNNIIGVEEKRSACAGQVDKNRDTAQANFRASCGKDWDDGLRHQCTWVDHSTPGWICHEYAPNGLAAIAPEEPALPAEPLSKPWPIQAAIVNGGFSLNNISFVNVVWRKDAGTHGINVYRNDQWVASVNHPGTVYNDYDGQLGDRYYLVAYDRDNHFSERSAVFSARYPRPNRP